MLRFQSCSPMSGSLGSCLNVWTVSQLPVSFQISQLMLLRHLSLTNYWHLTAVLRKICKCLEGFLKQQFLGWQQLCFCQDFTSISEELKQDDLILLLTVYLSVMTRIIESGIRDLFGVNATLFFDVWYCILKPCHVILVVSASNLWVVCLTSIVDSWLPPNYHPSGLSREWWGRFWATAFWPFGTRPTWGSQKRLLFFSRLDGVPLQDVSSHPAKACAAALSQQQAINGSMVSQWFQFFFCEKNR